MYTCMSVNETCDLRPFPYFHDSFDYNFMEKAMLITDDFQDGTQSKSQYQNAITLVAVNSK